MGWHLVSAHQMKPSLGLSPTAHFVFDQAIGRDLRPPCTMIPFEARLSSVLDQW